MLTSKSWGEKNSPQKVKVKKLTSKSWGEKYSTQKVAVKNYSPHNTLNHLKDAPHTLEPPSKLGIVEKSEKL